MDGHVTCDNDTIKLSDCFSFAFSRNQFLEADVLLCFNTTHDTVAYNDYLRQF